MIHLESSKREVCTGIEDINLNLLDGIVRSYLPISSSTTTTNYQANTNKTR